MFIEVELIIPPASTRIKVAGALFSPLGPVLPDDGRPFAVTKECVYEPWVQSEVALHWKAYTEIRMFRRIDINSFFDA